MRHGKNEPTTQFRHPAVESKWNSSNDKIMSWTLLSMHRVKKKLLSDEEKYLLETNANDLLFASGPRSIEGDHLKFPGRNIQGRNLSHTRQTFTRHTFTDAIPYESTFGTAFAKQCLYNFWNQVLFIFQAPLRSHRVVHSTVKYETTTSMTWTSMNYTSQWPRTKSSRAM